MTEGQADIKGFKHEIENSYLNLHKKQVYVMCSDQHYSCLYSQKTGAKVGLRQIDYLSEANCELDKQIFA